MELNKRIIYGLLDPRTSELRYIGLSTRGLARPRQSFAPSMALREGYHKRNWYNQLRRLGLRPSIVVLEYVPDGESLEAAEHKHILHHRSIGSRLINVTNGGEVIPTLTEGGRAKIVAANRGRVHTKESSARKSVSLKIAFATPEARRRLSEAHRGRRHSPIAIERMRLAAQRNTTRCARIKNSLGQGGGPIKDQYGTVYDSQRDAARRINGNSGDICNVLSGKLLHSRGFEFRRLTADELSDFLKMQEES